jgi:hypothetical protein
MSVIVSGKTQWSSEKNIQNFLLLLVEDSAATERKVKKDAPPALLLPWVFLPSRGL